MILSGFMVSRPTEMDSPIIQFHFSCVIFGFKPSPAILGDVILHHLDKYNSQHPQLIDQIKNGLYVNELDTSTDSVELAFQVHSMSKSIMKEGD